MAQDVGMVWACHGVFPSSLVPSLHVLVFGKKTFVSCFGCFFLCVCVGVYVTGHTSWVVSVCMGLLVCRGTSWHKGVVVIVGLNCCWVAKMFLSHTLPRGGQELLACMCVHV